MSWRPLADYHVASEPECCEYQTPDVKVGDIVEDAIRGHVVVKGFVGRRVSWPVGGEGTSSKSLIVFGQLLEAVQREPIQTIVDSWNVSHATVVRWRRALRVKPVRRDRASEIGRAADDPNPREILQIALEIRKARTVEIHFIDGTPAQLYAAAVLSNHARSIKSWSKNWASGLTESEDYFELLGRAMLAQEFFTCESRQLLNLDECCRLLRSSREEFWAQLWKEIDPSAWCWLAGMRAIEMIVRGEPGDEPKSLTFDEWQPVLIEDSKNEQLAA